MPRKKISVVNIDENDNKNDDVIDVIEPVNEPIEIPQEVIEIPQEPIETVETPPVEDTPVTPPESTTKTRVQELIKCPKCNKMVKAKTLKYSHKNTCSGEEKNVKTVPIPEPVKIKKTVPKPEPVEDIEDIKQQPKLNRTMSILPDKITITPDMIREHRKQIVLERIQMRQDNMKNLFANSIR